MSSAKSFVATAIGAVFGLLVGYFVYAASNYGIGFGYWLGRPELWWPWPIFGALVGVGLLFVAARR